LKPYHPLETGRVPAHCAAIRFRKTSHFIVAAVLLLSLAAARPAAGQEPGAGRLEEIAKRYSASSWDMLHEFLSIPNDAHFPEQIAANRDWVDRAFRSRGFYTRILPTAGHPLLLAERTVAGAPRTVLIYLQIDGQPVDPSRWNQESPFFPVLKHRQEGVWTAIPWNLLQGPLNPDWRVFARSASDAKGPVAMLLTTLDAMAGEGLRQTFNMKVIMDFEEEQGSPSLPAAVERHRDALAADMLIIFDGPRHVTNRPMLTFGARGIATITLTVFGPRAPQHSGHYGNYIPNPALRLSQLLASMKDETGRVVIPGFYDGVELDEETRRILAGVPDDEVAIRRDMGIAAADRVAGTLQEAIQYPSLNVRGLASGWVGNEVRTIVPATATAEIDVRLVPESDPERLIGLIRSHIEDLGYHLTAGPPSDEERARHPRLASFNHNVSYGAFRTPFDSEVGLWLQRALTRAFGSGPILKRMSGGSIPIAPFIQTLDLPAVTVPTVNADNNQHSPNENLRIGNYIEGVRTFLAILTQPFEGGN
jgi:acetylornithine deacetylase/succinyl-diaminopimelate desuccinylase-like protein